MEFKFSQLKTKTALFISPHLDDAAFSCGGTLLELSTKGWQIVLCTIFTASVPDPIGFALSCQTDKGLPPDVDYMKIRRGEDLEFARLTGIAHPIHLNFAEAPHRGYLSAPQLFAGIKGGDEVWREVSVELTKVRSEFEPALIFAPQGIGNHVDHLHTIKAVIDSDFADKTIWYQDTPYIIRYPEALPSSLLPVNLAVRAVDFSARLEQKIAACGAYQTQIGFQFGGAADLSQSFRKFHLKTTGNNINYLETFLFPSG